MNQHYQDYGFTCEICEADESLDRKNMITYKMYGGRTKLMMVCPQCVPKDYRPSFKTKDGKSLDEFLSTLTPRDL